ncbi:MAG: hypothetical protein EOP83_08025 [Verrucomicrobiaceae bacterium]|nr:MAG: hypothetical protein EOP83_08025 [Verrucomicrobiaceae bacterium]
MLAEPEGSAVAKPTFSRWSSDGGPYLVASFFLMLVRAFSFYFWQQEDVWTIQLPAFILATIGWLKSKDWVKTGVGMGLTGVAGGEFFGGFLFFLRIQGIW